MIDVNIIANGDLAKLLALEAERLGLIYTVSSKPEDGAKLYIADADLCDLALLSPEKAIIIGGGEGFSQQLPKFFLLSDLRQKITDTLIRTNSQQQKQSVKRSRKRLDISIDRATSCAILRGTRISLSPTEFLLLEALLERRGEILGYEEAGTLISSGDSNKVNVYICFLRKKLEAGGDKIIYSIRGKGFMIK